MPFLRSSRVLLISALVIVGIGVAVFVVGRRNVLPPLSSDGIPLPFGRSVIIRGSLTQIAEKDAQKIFDISFDDGELREQESENGIAFIVTPRTKDFSVGAPLSRALTASKAFYGYLYCGGGNPGCPGANSRDATKERERREYYASHPLEEPSYSDLFPGTFFASPSKLADQAFVDGFAGKGITFSPASDVPLAQDARYVLVVEDATASSPLTVTIRGLTWCGDGIVQDGEECDDGVHSGGTCDISCHRLNAGNSNQIFVTANTYIPADLPSGTPFTATQFSGLAGADALCQSLAQGKKMTGSWKAILSDSRTNARFRIHVSGPIVAVSETSRLTTVAATPGELWSGFLRSPVLFDENGAPFADLELVHSGTRPDGMRAAGDSSCGDWARSIGTEEVGKRNVPDARWIGIYSAIEQTPASSCSAPAHLYCIEEDRQDGVCGNGSVESGEACDDGNQSDEDFCSVDCTCDERAHVVALGDRDRNGTVSEAEAKDLLGMIELWLTTDAPAPGTLTDVNCDGDVDTHDAESILGVLAHLFPN